MLVMQIFGSSSRAQPTPSPFLDGFAFLDFCDGANDGSKCRDEDWKLSVLDTGTVDLSVELTGTDN